MAIVDFKKIERYLKGDEFDDMLFVDISDQKFIYSKHDFLIKIAENKRILHVGCLDHIPLIDARIKKGIYTHAILTEAAEYCLGIDINKEGIDYVKQRGFDNIIYADITSGCATIENDHFDYAILADVLEHIPDPVTFLSSFKRYKNIDKLIITVPNAYRFLNWEFLGKGFERINTDHRFWFTPYTLAKVCVDAGYKIDDFEYITPFYKQLRKFGFFWKSWKKFPNHYSSGMAITIV